MKRKRMSRVISMLLVAAMLFTMTGVSAFAEGEDSEEKEAKTVLVFGASTSSGYGLSNFVNENRGFAVENNDLNEWTIEKARNAGKGKISEDSYPWKLKKYIAETEFDNDLNKVTLVPMTFNGMRTNELHGLLDPEYAKEAYDEERRILSKDGTETVPQLGFYEEHIRSIVGCMGDGGALVDMEDGQGEVPVWKSGEPRDPHSKAYERAHKYVVEEIKKADVIVVDVCMNNFGTYLACRLSGNYGIPGYEDRKNLILQTPETIVGASPEVVKNANKIKETLQKMVPMVKDNENIQFIIDSFIYCLIDAMTNMSADVELIREINPNAKIITVGVYNTLDGISTVVNDKEYDFAGITAKGFSLLNTYIKGIDKNSSNYYYADVQSNVETFMNQIVNSEESYADFISDDDNNDLLEKMYYGPGSFYNTFLNGMDVDQLREPSKMLLYKAAKSTCLHMDELMGNLSNLFAIGNEMTAYFTAMGVFPNIPAETYQLNEEQKVAAASYFIDQKLKGIEDDTAAMTTAIQTVLGYPYTWEFINDKGETVSYEQIAKSAAYTVAVENYGVDEDSAAKGIGVDPANKEDIKPCPQDSTMELMQILDRFIVYQGIGQHPSKKGCESMFQDVKAAYDKAQNGGNTAYEDQKEEIMALLAELKALLDNTPAGEDIDRIIETLDKIEAALPMLDEAQMTLEEINAIKAQFYDYYGQALDLLGITEEDLINQGKFIAENVDWEQLAEWIKKMNEIAEEYPELREKYEPVIREYAEKIYDFVDKAMDEVIKAKDKIDVDKIMEYIQTAEDIIDQIKDVIKNAPTEAEIREKLEELQKIVEEKVKEISEELYEQLKAISEQLNEFVDGIDYEQILEELQPIMDQIKEMGIAVYQLPEYEKIIDEYAEVLAKLGNDSAELKDEVSALLEQVEDLKKQTEDKSALIAKLTAKAIRPDLVTKVTFPSGKVKVTLSWDKDPDAAGYVLTVNGEKKEFKETADGFIYEDTAAEVGTTYKFEVVPYVTYNGETINGKTFKASVVPKVKLKKAVIKKLKAGNKSFTVKWKKVSGASGYKVSYKLGKKTKNKTVKGGKKVSLKVKKLTSGKTYTVKVRAWKKVNGKKYYGKWSKAKKVTVK